MVLEGEMVKSRILEALAAVLLTILVAAPPLSGAEAVPKTLVVTAHDGEGSQELWLHGVKSPGASGVRVYVVPPGATSSTPNEKFRVATVFFSHGSANEEGQTFVIPLSESVRGEARIMVVPVSAPHKVAETSPQVESAEIKGIRVASR
jgi:hypothetical protein